MTEKIYPKVDRFNRAVPTVDISYQMDLARQFLYGMQCNSHIARTPPHEQVQMAIALAECFIDEGFANGGIRLIEEKDEESK